MSTVDSKYSYILKPMMLFSQNLVVIVTLVEEKSPIAKC